MPRRRGNEDIEAPSAVVPLLERRILDLDVADGPERCQRAYRHTRAHRDGRIQVGGVDKDVTFADADHDLDDQIDEAYRVKYQRHSASYVGPMISPQARATTIKLLPRTAGA